jgi:GT2 family glycosyltransferase
MIVAVVVASLGRPEALSDLLADLAQQTRVPDRILLSVTSPEDLPANVSAHPNAELVYGPRGSCAQRNAALDQLGAAADVVLFFDDDYVPSRFAVERATQLLAERTDIAGACGHLVADGINGPGIPIEEARRMLAEYDGLETPLIVPSHDLGGLYGCNMVFRTEAIRDLRFDERLPLYGWQEDIDFAARARVSGRIVKTFAFAGVHRGIKGSRSSGIRVGYSQVANPAYLVRKGTMDRRYARKIVVRNFAANHLRALRPEPWVDRLGRVRGNWLGLLDLLVGRVTPERILEL